MSELLEQAGYLVMSAIDGFKAVAACRVRLPDLIILDIQMPLISGLEVRKMLKGDERTANIPIIFLDQKNHAINVANKNKLNYQDILFKPFDPADLLARIQLLIEKSQLTNELNKQKLLAEAPPETSDSGPVKSAAYFKDFLAMSIRQAKRYKVDLSVLLIGLDKAQMINEVLSKESLDEFMDAIGQKIAMGLRDSDIVAFTGKNEFTVVLTHTSKNGAIEVAERIRNSIMNTTFLISKESIRATVSIGLCQYVKEMGDNSNILVSNAKLAMTQGLKSSGNITLVAE